jgi:hypothetical protein
MLRACRERWALVVALVAGDTEIVAHTHEQRALLARLYPQRDAVFSALADMARAEKVVFDRQEEAIKAMDEPLFLPDNFMRAEPNARASASILERYVERLIERVGVL